MLTNANELNELTFTFIIDLAVCKSTSEVERADVLFVVYEINIAFPIFLVNSYTDIFIGIPIIFFLKRKLTLKVGRVSKII